MTNIYTDWREGRLGAFEAAAEAVKLTGEDAGDFVRLVAGLPDHAKETLAAAFDAITREAWTDGHNTPNAEREEAAWQEGYERGYEDGGQDEDMRAEIEDAAADAAWHDAMEMMSQPAPAGSMAARAQASLALAGVLSGADRENALADWRHEMKLLGM